jgi:protoporphyrinogen oxidase
MSNNQDQKAVIIGAGPAGLTAAYELLQQSQVKPVVLEATDQVGGLSRTVNYKGNRIDLGGHRFFSKSDWVMDWWTKILPIEARHDGESIVSYQGKSRAIEGDKAGPSPDAQDNIMLVRNRRSRIYFRRQFFDYPIKLSVDTLMKMGPINTVLTGFSFIKAKLIPVRPEKSLEDFFINRFGKHLYKTFFQSYTEKVWGVPCSVIDASWGAQRVKGLDVAKLIKHALSKMIVKSKDVKQKGTEVSLIERFLYPKHGPGQLWEYVTEKVNQSGGSVSLHREVQEIQTANNKVEAVVVKDTQTGQIETIKGDYFISSMPVRDLMQAMKPQPPQSVMEIANGLIYRDFITVGLLIDKLKVSEGHPQSGQLIKDNWIYIQEPDVSLGRLQLFNNWSPYLVSDPNKVWLGLEYFCTEGDELWNKPDKEMELFAIDELDKIGIIDKAGVLDYTVIHAKKAYPAYFGTYDRFDELRHYLDSFSNLFLIGRNGMHRYNNQDHSMLTALAAVENIVNGVTTKDNIWDVNTEAEYHEEKTVSDSKVSAGNA